MILFDIMPMDVCHILLGRPWQYNKKAIHDGRRNLYTFEKDGEKHTLFPLKEESVAREINPKVLLISGKEFLQEIKNVEVNFVVVGKLKVILNNTNSDELPK
jgi:hypothetical protein